MLDKLIEEIREKCKEFEGQPTLNNRLKLMERINKTNDYTAFIHKGKLVCESKIIIFNENTKRRID